MSPEPMSTVQLLALLPILILAATTVLVMLQVAFAPPVTTKNHGLVNALTSAGLLAALISLWQIHPLLPQQVTPLLRVDDFALFYTGLILLAGLVVTLLSFNYFDARDGEEGTPPGEYYILLLIATLGAIVLVASNHFASFFIGLELLGVSLYVMVAYLGYSPTGIAADGREASLEAGVKYLILSGVASALVMFGIALLYAEFGTLEFPELAQRWSFGGITGNGHTLVNTNLYIAAGLALVLAGICFKLSLVPFHMWTPDVYQGAPAPVTAFIATVSKGAIFAFMLRLFRDAGALDHQIISLALALIAIASMLGGNLLALLQNNIKRLLAYSSIAHIGYLMVAFLAGTALASDGVDKNLVSESIAFYLAAYFVTTLGAFGVVTALSHHRMAEDLDDIAHYRGLFWQHPALALMLTAMLLSLAGIPLTVGFIGKFYLFNVATQGLLWVLLAALILGSAIGLYYYLRLIVALFSKQEDTQPEQSQAREFSYFDGCVLAGVSLVMLALGVYPQPMIEWVQALV